MTDLIKIYKTDLQQLIKEGNAPFYVSNFRTHIGGDIPTVIYTVTVAAFNAEGRVCELVLSRGPIWTHDEQEVKKSKIWADQMEGEILERLLALELETRDGRISQSPVLGGLG